MNDQTAYPLPHSVPPGLQRGPFVPLLLLTLAVVGWFVFQAVQLINERHQLTVLRIGQEAPIEAAGKLRANLDTLAASTAELAQGGNVSARLLVGELRKRGITINPGAPGGAQVVPK